MPNTARLKFRAALAVASCWLSIIALLYVVLESLFFCCIINLFPYSVRVDMGFGVYPILQTSKQESAPTQYTAIFGDSYGFGAGDWFLQVQHQRKPTFNTAHILHEKTDQEFISFAIPGSSNLCGWIEDPLSAINYINTGFRHHLTDPQAILLFFYEGNDINELETDFQARYISNGYDPSRMSDPDYFADFIQHEMLDKNRYLKERQDQPLITNLYLYRLAMNIIRNWQNKENEQTMIKEAIEALKNPPRAERMNKARIAGRIVNIPADLGEPPIKMTAEQKQNSLAFIDSIAGYVKKRFRDSHIAIIYIPSPVMTYELTSPVATTYSTQHEDLVPVEQIQKTSNNLCNSIHELAKKHDFSFLDTRTTMLDHGRKMLLHGPLDTSHLNENGYRALASSIQDFLLPWQQAGHPLTLGNCAEL